MLVHNGHGIILKSIMGRIPAAVTHMSFGTGYGTGLTVQSNFTREALGFEVVRVPIQVAYDHLVPFDEQNVDNLEDFQLVYKGEIPTNQRVAFNEIGLWCGSSNVRYGDSGGILLTTADSSETWIHKVFDIEDGEMFQVDQSALQESDFFNSLQYPYYDSATLGFKPAQPRIGNNAIRLDGFNNRSQYEIKLDVDLSQFSPLDTMKFAMTWTPDVDVFGAFVTDYDYQYDITFDFKFSSGDASLSLATRTISYHAEWKNDIVDNRCYKIIETQLGELTDASRGLLKSITVSIATITQLGSTASNPFPILDGIRVDRSTNNNPLYGLVFYDPVFKEVTFNSNTEQIPIEKLAGLDGHIEHRVRLYANATSEITV